MVGRYKEYPEYKNTDIKFLKNIPTHWVTSKVRYISSFGRGLSITKADLQDSGVPCVSYGEVHSMFGFEVDPKRHLLKCVNEEYLKTSSYALLSKGDFVFADTSEDIDGSGNFTQLISDERVFAGYHTVIVRPNLKNHYRFIAYLFDSAEFRTQIQDAVKGVKVFSITQAILKSADVWFPSYEEQQKIANFLDHEIAKIDTLIAKQEKLIELLKEKRQAVISHAVTKGLNPDIPMKKTGSNWVDEIPQHWRSGRLGYFARIGNGATPARDNKEYWEKGSIGWLNSSKVNDEVIYEADQFITPLALSQTSVKLVVPEDLVMAITGEGQTRGRVAICQINATINQHLASIKIYGQQLHYEFLFQWLSSNYERIRYESSGAGATKGAITCGDISRYPIIVAPIKEQIAIIEYLKAQTTKFMHLINKSELQINLLKERKAALISAAVTGKIDVRDWIIPDEAQRER
ncbi:MULTISPECIES: restriction endonuclease subunit S [Providencia]|uniref:Restriction endonuclease subunit S n=1 Tax=Providencia rettgeri TaxID=587 RepID=A0AAW6UGD2_PRORE|nr:MULTISPECIES: restriction endonuclease subunit S [Providencia]MDI9094360.1 restriction endonuclease subunit S [Providencia rettgeri]MDT2035529.1 restriction endonuclease subunit S [Providencia rettgeri]